jgi:predicted ribosome quality control (RQC) complex YloA/Tae2 family protein
MGKHSNLILYDAQSNLILDGIKRYSHAVSRHREVLPGKIYLPPPPQNKIDPLEIKPEELRDLIWPGTLNQGVVRAIFQKVSGISPQLAKEIVFRAGLKEDTTLEECGDYELSRIEQSFGQIKKALTHQDFQPTLVTGENNELLDFAAVALHHLVEPPNRCQEFSSISELLDTYYKTKQHQTRWQEVKQALARSVSGQMERSYRKLSLREDSLYQVQEAERYRLFGELLMTNLYQITSGAEETTLENLYQPEEPPVTVPLLAHLSPVENAQHYFKRYNKARRSLQIVEEQLQMAQQEIAYFESVSHSLETANTLEDLQEIRLELIEQGYLKPTTPDERKLKAASKTSDKKSNLNPGKSGTKKSVKGNRKGVNPKGKENKTQDHLQGISHMTLKSSEGYEILIGKNNKQNDYLTIKLARKHDVWLHVKEIPGSHVIIRATSPALTNNEENLTNPAKTHLEELIPNLNVSARALKEAALLAAYFSKARYSGSVPVDYTLRRYVRKPAGAKPGYVIYEQHQTIYVTPSEDNLGNLLKPPVE